MGFFLSIDTPNDEYDSESKVVAKKITKYYSVKYISIIISRYQMTIKIIK